MPKEKQLLNNAQFLMEEIEWFKQVTTAKINIWHPPQDINEKTPIHQFETPKPPDVVLSKSVYSTFIKKWKLNNEERIALILALIPHIAPQVLDVFFTINTKYNRCFTEFGGVERQIHKGFIPTWETFNFIIAGNNLAHRIKLEQYFNQNNHRFFTNGILEKQLLSNDEPKSASAINVTPHFREFAIFEKSEFIPLYNHQFPAELYTPSLDWNDLILPKSTLKAVERIIDWIEWGKRILKHKKAQKMLQPGFRAIFYGAPGTGKSLTAGLIGKTTNRLVFRIDLSKVISKYIGETEKNLANIFDQAQFQNWILFFDEADALFGKRVKTNDAKDRYANQETAYLLQRIETFSGIVILSSNQIANLDKAFSRRFQAMIHFPKPGLAERIQLWKNIFDGFLFDTDYNTAGKQASLWKELAGSHQLTGANIQNILRESLLKAYKYNKGYIQKHHIDLAIEAEIDKEKRIF